MILFGSFSFVDCPATGSRAGSMRRRPEDEASPACWSASCLAREATTKKDTEEANEEQG